MCVCCVASKNFIDTGAGVIDADVSLLFYYHHHYYYGDDEVLTLTCVHSTVARSRSCYLTTPTRTLKVRPHAPDRSTYVSVHARYADGRVVKEGDRVAQLILERVGDSVLEP